MSVRRIFALSRGMSLVELVVVLLIIAILGIVGLPSYRGYMERAQRTEAKDALSLSGPANAALRKGYRKLKPPKAFAISDKTGHFGFDRGDGGRALASCEKASGGAGDCRIVVAD